MTSGNPASKSVSMAIPTEHWSNVGRVAVHAAWLEESAALICYASEGGWDMTSEHLRFAGSKQGLFRNLRRLAKALPETVQTVERKGGRSISRPSTVGRDLIAFIDGAEALLQRRNRVVHSVPWHDVFSGEVESIHPRSNARGPLPSTEECEALVVELVAAANEGQRLAPRVGSLLSRR